MRKFFNSDCYTLYCDNMLNLEEDIKPNSIDSIVTDPPYELNFMGKSWDNSGVAFQKDTWKKCFNVLKPGGYLLAFGGSRTFHRIACAIEDAGFEIRDTIMWLYGCLSEDTEVLTRRGFKNFFEVTKDDEIRVYDIESGIYKWEKPQRWNVYKTEQDTCYRIKSDRTDQLVSRNHRCLIERDGKLVFEFAENLCDLERVPVLSYDIPYIQERNKEHKLLESGKTYTTTLATITKEKYTGIIFCPTVTTGCFVARRNGKIFITGNSGFPKSMNIGLAIDKKNGVESELGGVKPGHEDFVGRKTDGHMKFEGGMDGFDRPWMHDKEKREQYHYQKIPTSDSAKQWKGWGTCLKPAFEPVIVARKPFSGSLIDNVLEYGVGGLNIDECRVEAETNRRMCGSSEKSGETSFILGAREETYTNKGRFPANIILTYDETDFDEVCGGFPNSGSGNGGNVYSYSGREYHNKNTSMFNGDKPQSPSNYNDNGSAARYFAQLGFSKKDDVWKYLFVSNAENNLEILQAIKENIVQMNVEGLLNELIDLYVKCAGNKSNQIETSIVQDIVEILTWDFKIETSQVIQDFIGNYKKCTQLLSLVQFVEWMESTDTTQITQNLLKLFGYVRVVITNYILGNVRFEQRRYLYEPKASKKDRNDGCDSLPTKPFGMSNQAIAEINRVNENFSGNKFNKVQYTKNNHPCVKPTELIQYLIRLVTPDGGTILDPFNGSGSTGKAAMFENKERNKGYRYIGIELDEDYLNISKARIDFAIGTNTTDWKLEEQPDKKKDKDDKHKSLW